MSKVIKAVDIGGQAAGNGAGLDGPGFVRLDRPEGEDTGSIIEAARKEAGEILAAAGLEAESLREEARKAGREEGLAEGREKGREEFSGRIRALADLVAELSRHRGEIFRRQGEELFELVRVMVEHICLGEIERNPVVIQRVVAGALEHVLDRSEVVIRVHPADFDIIQQSDGSEAILGAGERVRIVEDEGVSRGGCRVETGFGEVDATLETRRDYLFRAVEDAFIEAVAAAEEGDVSGD